MFPLQQGHIHAFKNYPHVKHSTEKRNEAQNSKVVTQPADRKKKTRTYS
jgi:hypothetical protein